MYVCFCETEVTSTPTRPVDNVFITTKGLQDRNIHILDGATVENKGKLILTIMITLTGMNGMKINLLYNDYVGETVSSLPYMSPGLPINGMGLSRRYLIYPFSMEPWTTAKKL